MTAIGSENENRKIEIAVSILFFVIGASVGHAYMISFLAPSSIENESLYGDLLRWILSYGLMVSQIVLMLWGMILGVPYFMRPKDPNDMRIAAKRFETARRLMIWSFVAGIAVVIQNLMNGRP